MKDLVKNCDVHVVNDQLVLNGENTDKYANILFNHGVKTKHMYFRVFTALKWEDDTCYVTTDMNVMKKVYPEIFYI